MSEMALTADHLIIIGRGRLIADTPMDTFVLAFTAEHSTGLIRTTFAAVPRRRAVLAAKAATAGAVALAAGEVLAFASFFPTARATVSGRKPGCPPTDR
jgi:hypothetical protein